MQGTSVPSSPCSQPCLFCGTRNAFTFPAPCLQFPFQCAHGRPSLAPLVNIGRVLEAQGTALPPLISPFGGSLQCALACFADSPQPRFLCCSSYIVQRRRLIRLGGSLARSCACSFSSRSRGRRPGPRDVQRGRFGYTPLLCLSVCLALSLSLSLFPVSGFCLLFAMLL